MSDSIETSIEFKDNTMVLSNITNEEAQFVIEEPSVRLALGTKFNIRVKDTDVFFCQITHKHERNALVKFGRTGQTKTFDVVPSAVHYYNTNVVKFEVDLTKIYSDI